MLSLQRNPCTDCKSTQQWTTRGHPLYTRVISCGMWQWTERHTDRLLLTWNVIIYNVRYSLYCISHYCTQCHLHSRIFKQSIVGIEHVFGKKEKPFTSNSTIIKTRLRLKLNPQPTTSCNQILLKSHHSTRYIDVAYCYRQSSMVCLSQSWALQKSMNQSRCHLGCGFGWA